MEGVLHQHFTTDHRRLDTLLSRAIQNPASVDMDSYGKFRTGLLKHIKLEENILFRASTNARKGEPLPIIAQLRLDHGALTSLMVPSPTPQVIKALLFILERHDRLEEQPGGLYDACDELTRDDIGTLMESIRTTADVPVHPHNDSPIVFEAAQRSLTRAGYHFDEFA